jgi:hypothetical protein
MLNKKIFLKGFNWKTIERVVTSQKEKIYIIYNRFYYQTNVKFTHSHRQKTFFN